MKLRTLTLYLALLPVAAPCFAARSFHVNSESSASEVSGPNGTVNTVVNTSYAFTSLYVPQHQNFTPVLLVRRIESTTYSGREGADSKLQVIAWTSGKSSYDTRLWVINDCGEDGGMSNEYYETTNYGCCGAEDIHRAYNRRTGKYRFSFTTEPVFVDVPNANIKRTISYVSANGAPTDCGAKGLPRDAIGALTLSDGDRPIDRILLVSADGELAWSPKLALIDDKEPKGTPRLTLWHSNGMEKPEAVTGFSVRAFYYDGMQSIIPVTGDRFDLQKASLPKGIALRRIAVK